MVRDRGAAGQPYSSTVGIKLTIPLSSALVRQAQAAALAALEQAQAEYDQLQRKLALEAEQAQHSLESSTRASCARHKSAWPSTRTRSSWQKRHLRWARAACLPAAGALRCAANPGQVSQQQGSVAAARSRLNQALGALPNDIPAFSSGWCSPRLSGVACPGPRRRRPRRTAHRKNTQTVALAPRAEAQTDAFELVATLEQDRLY